MRVVPLFANITVSIYLTHVRLSWALFCGFDEDGGDAFGEEVFFGEAVFDVLRGESFGAAFAFEFVVGEIGAGGDLRDGGAAKAAAVFEEDDLTGRVGFLEQVDEFLDCHCFEMLFLS